LFQTEPIIYLQSLGNEWLTFLMILITTMGSSSFLAAITIITTFGVDFKKGFLLYQLLLWTGLATEVLKALIAFPRPDFVDNRVLNLESGMKNTSPFNGEGPGGIFELPDKEILRSFRLQEAFTNSPFGFPSGHVSLTTALWGGIVIIFNSKITKMLTPLVIVIVAFSRMYLGRHFLGDVLGGAAIGLIFLVIFARFLKSPLRDDVFKKENFGLTLKRKNLLFFSLMFVVPILFTALSLVSSEIAGLFLGTNIAYMMIIRQGVPNDAGSAAQRTARVFIALLLFGTSSLILDFMFKTSGATNYLDFTLIEFLKNFILGLTIWISVATCTKLELYKIDKEFVNISDAEWN